jgi:hypothetical protein
LLDECVSSIVPFGAGRCIRERNNVRFDDGIVEAIKHGVDAETEQVLVVLSVDIGGDMYSIG